MSQVLLDRRSTRRAATRAEIVAAAWDMAREEGLAGLSMRGLGDRVGMRAQSVYTYFASKNEIYDAMFRQGYDEYLACMAGADADADCTTPLEQVQGHARRFFSFCTSDPVRYQLLFLRTIPGFVPSDESYARAGEALAIAQRGLATIGVTDPAAEDLATALFTGLVSQQLANDPGGSRWERLVDRAAAMLMAEIAPDQHTRPLTTAPRKSASRKQARP